MIKKKMTKKNDESSNKVTKTKNWKKLILLVETKYDDLLIVNCNQMMQITINIDFKFFKFKYFEYF